jgi:dTDP-4-amino-4,6-dideoxygalactose transaminase
MLTIQRFDPTPCGFPPPQVAVLPQPEMAGFRARRNDGDERLRWYARARYALTDAYRLCGLDKGGELIAPSYHCRTMIDPALAIGSHVQLYPLKEDLAPDLAALLPMLADRADRPRALLVSHFFGVAQPLDSIAAACREQRVSLIEDCSHALPRRLAADSPSAVGEVGDFAVASPYKFFACPDGGLLWSNRPALPPVALRPAPWRSEVQAAVDSVRAMVGRSLDSRGTPPQPVLPSASAAGRVWEESSDEPSEHYDRRDESGAPLRVSRCIVAHTDVARLVSRRRANYQAWAERVRGLRHCRALFPTLGSDCAPYMFALLLERPESDFAKLKRLGVPIWRWDEMARSQCAVARHYRMALIHLPCHQSLSRSELDWMIGAVERVCASSPERSAA